MRLVSRSAASYAGLLLAATLVALALVAAIRPAQAAGPSLESARALLAQARSYTIRTTITQRLAPLARPELIGQSDTTLDLLIDGTVVPGGESRYVFRRADAAPGQQAALIEQGGRLFVEQGGARAPVGSAAGALPTFAPLAYLAAAEQVRELEPATEQGQRYTRFAFSLDGRRFAQQLAGQTGGATTQAASALLQQLAGTGELWLRADGAPERQLLTLQIAQLGQQYRVTIQSDTRFANLIAERAPASPLAALAGMLPAPDAQLLCQLAALGLALAGMLLIRASLRRSWRTASRVLLLSQAALLLATPALLPAPAPAQAAAATLAQVLAPAAVPTPAALPAPAQTLTLEAPSRDSACGAGAPGADTDGDGLTDQQEQCLGSDPYRADTDSDGIADGAEVDGLTFAGQQWPTDPLSPDSNRDGRLDTAEWPTPLGAAPNPDLDADGVPNAWDADDDGDDVPDELDLSPEARTGQLPTFTISTSGDGYAGYEYIELQVRTADPARMRYPGVALDWPYDNEGQIQDLDSSQDDLRLVPLLEVTASQAPDPTLASRYNVTVVRRDGKTVLYLPLTPVGAHGQVSALTTRLAFGPGQNAGVRLEARMIWMLNGALDRQGYGQTLYGMPTVVQTYTEPTFQVTGLQIGLSHDVESAILALPGQPDDRSLFQLLYGWQAVVLGAAQLDGQSASRSVQQEAIFRLTEDNTPLEQRFGLPADAVVAADLQRYGHIDEALADLSSRRVGAFIGAHGYGAASRPALALAFQEETGAYGFDDLGRLDPGSSLSVSLSNIHRQQVRSLRLALYTNDGGWRQLAPDELQAVGTGSDVAPALAALQARYPRLSTRDLRALLGTIYVSWGQGLTRAIAADGAVLVPASLPNADVAAGLGSGESTPAAYLIELLGLGAPGAGLRVGQSLAADYAYQRAPRGPLGLNLHDGDQQILLLTRNSTSIAGQELIPILSVGGGFALYKGYKSVEVLSHFVKDGKNFTKWFEANKTLGKMSTAGKVMKFGGAILSVGMAWTQFGLGTDFSNPKAIGAAVSLAIVSTAITIALLVVSFNPAGAVLGAILGIIDLILFFTTGNSLTDRISRAVAEFFYDYNILTQLDHADFRDLSSSFADPNTGAVVGNRFFIASSFVGAVSRTDDGSRGDLADSWVWGAFDPTSSPGATAADANGPAECSTNRDETVKTCTNSVGAVYLLVAPKINTAISFTGRVRSVTLTEECIMGDCDSDYEVDDLPEDRAPSTMYLDVLPDSAAGVWGWAELTNPDPDGDGLTSGEEQQLGSSPTSWDSDSDTVGDAYEREIGTSPLRADTDGDGLSDAAELQYDTSPLRADTDGDGLSDAAELRRYEGGAWRGGWGVTLPGGRTAAVFSSPTLGDADGDSLSDAAEQASASSPSAANFGPTLDLRVTPSVAAPDGRAALVGRPGDTLRIELAVINGGASAISSTLALCLPDLLVNASGGALYGARRPAAQVAACASGQRYDWPLVGANALQVGELITATLTAQIDPALVASAAGTIRFELPYLASAEAGAPARIAQRAGQVLADLDDPTVTLAGAADGALLHGSSLVLGGTVSDPTSWVTSVELSADGGASYQPATFAEHSWASSWALPADGSYTLLARATDQLGRRGTSAPIHVRVDNTAPSAGIAVSNNAVLRPGASGEVVALAGTASDNLAGLQAVQISIDGKPWRDVTLASPGAPGSAWSYDWQLPGGSAAQGRHSIAVRALDRAGNRSADGITTRDVLVDVAPPTDDLTTSDYLAATPPAVQTGVPTTLTGRADDTGNAPRPARPQPLSGTLDALQGATVWLMPDAAAELSAASTANWLGDMNGDGKGDLAVGLPAGAAGAGRVVLVYGRGGDWPSIPDAEALASSGSSFVGGAGAGLGGLLAPAGDANADGFSDLLIGDAAAGRGYLVFGRDGALGRDLTLDERPAAGRALIAAPGLRLLAAAGDVNGDGADDLLVGAGAQLALLLGRADDWPGQIDPAIEAAALLPLPAGAAASGVGDVNGDGRDDFAIGDPASGALWVYFGRADLARGAPAALSASLTYSDFGGRAQIAALGRVNGNAQSDFAYTTAGAPMLALDGGSASTLSYTGATGGFLAAPGDVNADGAADLLLGVPGSQSALLVDGDTRGVRATLTGVLAAASAPYAAGADLNCDTSSDLLLIPTAAPADAPPESARVLDPASFIAPSRLPGASVTSVPPAPAPSAGLRVVDDDFCPSCGNEGLSWDTNAFNTIQGAIDAAGAVSRIELRTGVYSAFSVGASRSGLAIVGAHPDQVFVDGAGGAYAAQVSGATGVRLAGMTLRHASYGVQLSSAGVGGASTSSLRIALDWLVFYDFTSAVRMSRDSTADITRSTIAGRDTSGSYISVDSAPDSALIPSWSAANISPVTVAMGAGAQLVSESGKIFALTGLPNNDLREYRPAPLNFWSSRMTTASLASAAKGAGVGDGGLYLLLPQPLTSGSVRAIVTSGANVYIAGELSWVDQAGAAVQVSNVAWWNGSSWSNMAGGPNAPGEYVSALTMVGSTLYAATSPISSNTGGTPCCGVFRWDGTSWTRILQSVAVSTSSGDPAVTILSMASDGSRLYVAGNFNYYTPNGGSSTYMGGSGVLVWSGSSWSQISSSSTFRPITALAVDPATQTVYAGTKAGEIWRARSGAFDSTALLRTTSAGYGDAINTLLWDGTALVAGGKFSGVSSYSGTFNNLLRYEYNATTFTTTVTPIGGGTDAPVHALASRSGMLYVAGNFTTAGTQAINDVAAWDGAVWTTFAGDVGNSPSVQRPLAVTASGDLLIGGDFQGVTSGGVTDSRIYDIARYTAGSWGPLAESARGATALLPTSLYRYPVSTGLLETRTPTWPDLEAGSAMVGDGASALYLLKGGGNSLYRYSATGDSWQLLSPMPARAADGTAAVYLNNHLFVIVGGGLSMYRYEPASDYWSPLASAPAALGSFGAGAGLAWDGRGYLYATNGGNGNQYARYSIARDRWETAQTLPFQIADGGSLLRVGSTIYASLGSATGATSGELRMLSPVGLLANKLSISGSAFVAPASAPSPDWIDLDASAEDFAYSSSANRWTLASGQSWASPGASATVGLASAQLLDHANNVYRVSSGSALSAGYFSPRPDAHVSPLYCPSCANDGYVWGQTAFSSVQAAIDSGAPRVLLAPGIFREAISLASGVQVIGAGADLSVLAPPSPSVRAVVTAEGVRGATLARVTVAGSGTGAANPLGVVVEQGAQQVRLARLLIRNTPVGVQVNDAATALEVVNNTIVGNAAGVQVTNATGSARVDVRNTLFASNSGIALSYSGSAALHRYNGYYQNGADISTRTAGLGDVTSDPLFVNPAILDYRLRDRSPMINAGNPSDPTPPGTSARVDIGYLQRGQAAFYAKGSYGPNAFNDGLDWQVDAFDSIQGALDAADRALRAVGCRADAGGTCGYSLTVGVGAGSYAEQVRVPSHVRLVGSGAEDTTIDGGAGSAVSFSGVVDASVSGFTLTGTAAGTGVSASAAANSISISRTIIRGLGVGVRFSGESSGALSFNTIVGNAAGVQADGAGSWLRAQHNILAGNTAGLAGLSGGALFSDFNLIYQSPDGAGVVAGDGIISGVSPLFVNAAANNYRLQAGSPALDQAAPWAAPPAGGGTRADLGYAELIAKPFVLLLGQEDLSCAAGNSGAQQTEVGIVRVSDPSLPITATLPLAWTSATMAAGSDYRYWSATVTAPADGYYRIYTRASDVAGNQEGATPALYSGALVADGAAPTVSWDSLTPISTSAAALELIASADDGQAADLAFEVSDGSSSFQISAGWSSAVWASGNREFRAVAALPAGSYTIKALARDAAGNVGRSAARSVVVSAPASHQATITTPASGGFTNQATLTVHGFVRFSAANGSGAVAVSIGGGAPVAATLADPAALVSAWSATVELGSAGAKTITATPSNASGAGTPASATITLDQSAPSITLPGATPLVTGTVTLSGGASDAQSGLDRVDVSFDGGYIWLPASLSGGSWSVRWQAPDSSQNVRYPTRVRARDRAGNEAIAALVLRVDTSAPVLGDVTFTIAPETRVDIPPSVSLGASWSPATDDGGLVTLYAAYDQLPASVPTTAVAGSSLSQPLNSAGAWYLHLRAVDAAGNSALRHFGPWYARDVGSCAVLPIALDGSIDLASGEWRADRNLLDDDERPATQQSLYAALDIDSLFLGWRGARWAVDGTLTLYFDTAAGGTATPAAPIAGVTGLPFMADLAISIDSPTEASMWRYSGGAWQAQSFAAADLAFAQSAGGDTEIRISRSLAGTPAHMLAFAADESGAPWSVFPTSNRATGGWGDAYDWTAVTDCTAALGSGQPGITSLDLALAPQGDPDQPLGPGASVAHTLRLENRETRALSGAQLRLSASAGLAYQSLSGASCPACAAGQASWSIALPPLAPGSTTLLTVTSRLDASLGALRSVTSTVALELGGQSHASAAQSQRVDGLPPSVQLTLADGGALLAGPQALAGAADDDGGAGVALVEVNPAGAGWRPADGTLSWTSALTVPLQPSWAVQVRATDRNGLTSAPQSYTFQIDQAAPGAGITLPAQLAGSTAVITGTASDPAPAGARVAAVEVQIGDASAEWLPAQLYEPDADGEQGWAFTWPLPAADNQPYQLRARAIDQAGNIGTPTAWASTLVDSAAPTITVTQQIASLDLASYPESALLAGQIADGSGIAQLQLRVFAPDGDSYLETVDLSGGAWSYTPQRALTAGAYRLVLESADHAGNAGQREFSLAASGQAPPPLSVAISRLDPAVTSAASVRFGVTFNMTVTQVLTSNFGLNTNGITGAAISGVAGSGASYTVTVDTGAGDGTLALGMLNSAGVQNIVRKPVSGLPLTGPAYTIDKTRPLVSIDPLLPARRNTPVAAAMIRFTKPITGFDLADLMLTRDGGTNLLSGGETLTSTDGLAWRLGGLSGLTSAEGGYLLALYSRGSGIADDAGNALLADASAAFTVDTSAPSAAIGAVTPSPRNTAVPTITLSFSEPVAGLSLANLALTRDGGANLLTSSATLSSTDGIAWQLGGLAGLTGAHGSYTLALSPAGALADLAGNALASATSISFTVDTIAPTVAAIEPLDPPLTIASSVRFRLRFSEPVATLSAANLRLETAGLTGAAISGVSGAGDTWLVTAATGSGNGTLGLRLANSAGLADLAGNPLTDFSATGQPYTIDHSALLATIEPLAPDPRNTPVAAAMIRFTKPITGFSLADLALTRDGGANLLTGSETLSSTDRITWQLGGLSGLTGAEGLYTLTLAAGGTGIRDGAGNTLAGPATRSFRVDTSAPTAAIDPVAPSPRIGGVAGMTIRLSEPVAGLGLADLALTRDGAPIDLSSATLVSDAAGLVWQLGGLARPTWAPGRYTLTLARAGVADLAGNPLAADASSSFDVTLAQTFIALAEAPPSGPDLVATVGFLPNRHSFAPDEPVLVTVTVTNRGDLPAGPFWADLMLNPRPVPTGPTLWTSTCTLRPCYGLTWYVAQGLAPGQSVTLTSRPDSFDRDYSRWSQFLHPSVRSVYLVVDSWNGSVPYGAVQESNEANNIVGITDIVVR